MRQKKLLQAYATNRFLRGWPTDELDRLERTSTIVTFAPGELVSRDTSSGREFMILLEGEATLTHHGERAELSPGDHLGEVAMLGGAHERSTVIAQTQGKALLLSEQEFVSLLQTTPSLGRRLAQHLVQELARG